MCFYQEVLQVWTRAHNPKVDSGATSTMRRGSKGLSASLLRDESGTLVMSPAWPSMVSIDEGGSAYTSPVNAVSGEFAW